MESLIIFILGIVMIWIFEHKIIPTVAVFAMALFQVRTELQTITEETAYTIFLYIIVMIYAAYMILAYHPESEQRDY